VVVARLKTNSTHEVAVRVVMESDAGRVCPVLVIMAIAVVAKFDAVALQNPAVAPSGTGFGGRVSVTAARGWVVKRTCPPKRRADRAPVP
jgi:hypothetical protein